jgi:hypothetical protein
MFNRRQPGRRIVFDLVSVGTLPIEELERMLPESGIFPIRIDTEDKFLSVSLENPDLSIDDVVSLFGNLGFIVRLTAQEGRMT